MQTPFFEKPLCSVSSPGGGSTSSRQDGGLSAVSPASSTLLTAPLLLLMEADSQGLSLLPVFPPRLPLYPGDALASARRKGSDRKELPATREGAALTLPWCIASRFTIPTLPLWNEESPPPSPPLVVAARIQLKPGNPSSGGGSRGLLLSERDSLPELPWE